MKKYEKMSKRRKTFGYTLESLGKKLGLSKQFIWDIEAGKRTLSYRLAYEISTILETTPDELFLEDYKRK